MELAKFDEVAKNYELGEFIEKFNRNPSNLFTIAAICGTVSLFPLLVPGQGAFVWGLFAALLLVSWGIYSMRQTKLVLYQEGFLRLNKKSKLEVIFYREINLIWQNCTNHNTIILPLFIPIPTGEDSIFTIKTENGLVIKLDNKILNIRKIGEYLQKQVWYRKMPKAISTYNSGHDLIFGDLVISRKGISNYKKDVLPWSELASVKVENGVLIVNRVTQKAGQQAAWSRISISRIANIYIFLSLIDQIHNRES
ncbi:MAG: hypothetical protein Kow00121_34370 [Elainellaceae cyanobacterium]